MDEQARGVHSLALDAVGPAGVGTSVLPADREHREAPVAHLGTRGDPGAWAGTPRGTGKTLPASHGTELPVLLGPDERWVSPLCKTWDINKPTHAFLLDAKGKKKKKSWNK